MKSLLAWLRRHPWVGSSLVVFTGNVAGVALTYGIEYVLHPFSDIVFYAAWCIGILIAFVLATQGFLARPARLAAQARACFFAAGAYACYSALALPREPAPHLALFLQVVIALVLIWWLADQTKCLKD